MKMIYIILIEEHESHSSHINLRRVIKTINDKTNQKQIIITTHINLIVKQPDISKLKMLERANQKLLIILMSKQHISLKI